MNRWAAQVCNFAETQHGVIARWQLVEWGWSRAQIEMGLRGLRPTFRGVRAVGDLTELGWYMAAALAMGPGSAISHTSALMLMRLRDYRPIPIHVSHLGGARGPREGLVPHERSAIETWTWAGIPVTTPSQSMRDADLSPHELYRAIEAAEKRTMPLTLPLDEVVRLKRRIRGCTKSDTEARFLFLLAEHRLPLPLVNHMLNGYEADFHWPRHRLVVEVDGWKHHREHDQFNEDRHRGLIHEAAGHHLIRVSADHVYDRPELVLEAVTRRL